MAFVRLLKDLMKDKEFGTRWVPIIPDEARTFGMDSLFPTAKIYSPHGQTVHARSTGSCSCRTRRRPPGRSCTRASTRPARSASFTAAGTSYATHGEPMIPLYIFYSMFGFQRTADGLWAAADQMARGFLLGATAGRTTLNGEGLQHEDGHSLLIAATNPAVVAYDPAFAFEIAHIVEDGLHRMYGEKPENVFYYLTVYNEPILQPAEPADVDVEGLLKGIYRYSPAPADDGPKAQILASGTGMQWALKAQQLLAQDWGVAADVWSVTSWTELRRDAVETEEHNLLHPGERAARAVRRRRRWPSADGPGGRGQRLDAGGAGPDLAAGCRATTRRWAPTASACPTPGTRCAGTSTSTPSRSRWRRCASWRCAARCRPRVPAEAAKKYAIDDVNAAPVGETGGDS